MSDEIPDWATVRAIALANAEIPASVDSRGILLGLGTGRALARYIAGHEEPPVDHLLVEARNVIAEHYGSTRMADGSLALGDGPRRVEDIKNGKGDAYWEVRCVQAALRRGIEIAKEQSA